MALKGKQKKLDANKDGKISGEDFSLLRERKAVGGFLRKFARKASEQVKEGVVLPKSDSVKQLKELGLSDVRIKEVLDEFEVMSGVEGFDSSIDEFIENVRADMPKYVNLGLVRENLQKQGLSDETIDQFFEDVRGRMGTKEANLQASKLMLRIAGMEGEPPMGGQDVGMNISRSQELAAEQLARKQLREEGIGDTFPDDVRNRMKKLLREEKAVGGIVRALSSKAKQILRRELPKRYRSIMTPEEAKYMEGSTTADDIIKEYERGENVIFYDTLDGEETAISANSIQEIISGKVKKLDDDDYFVKVSEDDDIPFSKGGTVDDQMNALAISVSPAKIEAKEMNSEMLPDEEMEEEYVDYVIESTLDDEDKNYLNRALEKDAKLSEIFDQVVESATEFTGSGTVEGPGTGISDSIPARLSDGEFVFTAKATEEIGEDRLMSMMKEAEARADGRQDMANGGMVMQEEPIFRPQPQPTQQDIRVTKETVGAQASMREEEDLIGNELKKSMLSTAPYVRS